jgi:hypothetical protein
MASRAENRVVNLAGHVQGITLVTFPAASSIFTEPTEYGLSNTQIRGNVPAPGDDRHHHLTAGRPVGPPVQQQTGPAVRPGGEYHGHGRARDHLRNQNDSAAHPLLLAATAFLGACFGLIVPVLNTYVAVEHSVEQRGHPEGDGHK